ncbi:hypothetical protein LTR94_030140, partial [Friedmanniomyces endolithicus]
MIPALSHAQPLAGFIGGLMIGLAAAVMLLALGRIAGVSGLAARALKLSDAGPPWAEATAFVLGLPLGAWLLAATAEVAPAHFPTTPLLLVAGLIVGYGTRLGSGCTSGHGRLRDRGGDAPDRNALMRALIALLCGTLFGAGLAVSGMTDPMRVRAFLDLLGPWDPTLAFVMAGAIVPMASTAPPNASVRAWTRTVFLN